jgi:DNA-binding beta-propeller fold protein YncE
VNSRSNSAATYCARPNYSSAPAVSASKQRVLVAATFEAGTSQQVATDFQQGPVSQVLGHCELGEFSFSVSGTEYFVVLATEEEAAKYSSYAATYLMTTGYFSSVQAGGSAETVADFEATIGLKPPTRISKPQPSAGYHGVTIDVGGNPEAMAVTPNGGFAYVIYGASNVVKIVNLATHKVATIHVGESLTDLAMTPSGDELYLTSDGGTNSYHKTVYALSTRTNTSLANINVGGSSSTVAISADGRFAYVTTTDALKIIDTATQHVTGSVPLATGFAAGEMVVSPDGKTTYVATNETSGGENVDSQILVIDVVHRKVLATIDQTVSGPCGLVASASSPLLYEATCGDSSGDGLRVFNERTEMFERGIKLNGGLQGIALQPGGKVLYAASGYLGGLSLIDAATTELTGHEAISTPTVELGGQAVNPGLDDLSISSDGSHLYALTNAILSGNSDLIVIALGKQA